jgi:hypothetical protein
MMLMQTEKVDLDPLLFAHFTFRTSFDDLRKKVAKRLNLG